MSLILVSLALPLCVVAQPQDQPATKSQTAVSDDEKPRTNKQVLEYNDDRAANFVFLVDVSGSMVLPRTMVTAADGKQITLFEALRSALKQIAQDQRVLHPNSKVAFITFGTQITEKSEWPSTLVKSEERAALLEKISSPLELQADKHGDTYMAGALEEAYKKALQFTEDSPRCTTTFILMFTDGWDEPPAAAPFNIKSTSAKIVAKEKELKEKLGVNTWQVRVIGLQRLPEKKAGTTTAAEVAQMLGGQFLDVTKAQGGTVPEQIYRSLKKTIEELKGQIDLPHSDTPGGIVNFGRITNSPRASGTVHLVNRSCYVEKVTAVREASSKLTASELVHFKQAAAQAGSSGQLSDIPNNGKNLTPVSTLPAGAIKVLFRGAPEFVLAPENKVEPNLVDSSSGFDKVDLEAQIGSKCPPGSYIGAIEFESTAKIPGKIPYVVSVPSRYLVEPEVPELSIRKKGFFLNQAVSGELTFDIAASVNSNYAMTFKFEILPESAKKIKKSGEKTKTEFAANLLNHGQPVTVSVSSPAHNATKVVVPVDIPADTEPGIYEGTLKISSKTSTEVAGPSELKYRLTVMPSPWDEMGPIAIPVGILTVLVLIVGVLMTIAGSRDRM